MLPEICVDTAEELPPMEPEEFLRRFLALPKKKFDLLQLKRGYRELAAKIFAKLLLVSVETARDWGKNDIAFSKMPECHKVNLAYRWHFINYQRQVKISQIRRTEKQKLGVRL